jgi:threonine dehydratase
MEEKLDYVVTPLGGGGLLSGTALSCQYWSKDTKVIGAEPSQKGDGFESFNS